MIRLWIAVRMLAFWVGQRKKALIQHDKAAEAASQWHRIVTAAQQRAGGAR